MTDVPAIEVAGLLKSYGRLPVLAGVDLRVPAGTVLALLGPNGAGKTTTVRILATLTRPDAGTVRVAGYDVLRQRAAVRRAVGLAGQQVCLDAALTGAENLDLIARLSGWRGPERRRAVAALLERFDLTAAAHRRLGTYSGGLRRRADLAATLLRDPAVILLDEPTAGLDPGSRRELWAVVADLARAGRTVLFTTQYLEEADQLADRITVIDGGRVVADAPPASLKRRFADRRLDLTLAGRAALDGVVGRLAGPAGTVDGPVAVDRDALVVSVPVGPTAGEVRDLLDALDPDRTAVRDFAVRTATLDDVFLALTGRRAEAAPAAATPERSRG
ncbi:MAG TPA: ATP-binding cassette domain-containing protein [Pilimelia sp.]|nr:ATP-binding cassette domain-containing protein [Pilimelia sp.]